MNTQQEYDRFVKIIENWVNTTIIETCMTTEFLGYDLDLDKDEYNNDKMDNLVETLLDLIYENKNLKPYTKIVTPSIKQIIIDKSVEMHEDRDMFYEEDQTDKYKILKTFVYIYLISNTHIVFNSIIQIYKQLH